MGPAHVNSDPLTLLLTIVAIGVVAGLVVELRRGLHVGTGAPTGVSEYVSIRDDSRVDGMDPTYNPDGAKPAWVRGLEWILLFAIALIGCLLIFTTAVVTAHL